MANEISNGPTADTNSETPTRQKHPSYLLQAWLVIFLSVLYGAILVWVQMNFSGRIEANKKLATFEQIPALVEGADPAKTREIQIIAEDGKKTVVYQVFDASENHIGWVFPGSGQGFGDTISLIIGLNPAADTLTGLCVLEQKETPGLGNFIVEEDFRSGFNGKNVSSLASAPLVATSGVPTAPNQVKAVTGATISSNAVCDIVNAAVSRCRVPALESAARN